MPNGGGGGEAVRKEFAAVQASLQRGAALAAAMREKNERLLRELAMPLRTPANMEVT